MLMPMDTHPVRARIRRAGSSGGRIPIHEPADAAHDLTGQVPSGRTKLATTVRVGSGQPATASRIARASAAVGRRGELRIAASSRVSVTSWAIAASSARPRSRRVGRWSTSRRSASMAPMAAPAAVDSDLGGRRDAERDPDEGQLAIAGPEVEAEDLRQDRGEGRAVGDHARASRSSARAHGRAPRRCRSPGRRRRGARPRASASAPRGPSRRRRLAAATRRSSG